MTLTKIVTWKTRLMWQSWEGLVTSKSLRTREDTLSQTVKTLHQRVTLPHSSYCPILHSATATWQTSVASKPKKQMKPKEMKKPRQSTLVFKTVSNSGWSESVGPVSETRRPQQLAVSINFHRWWWDVDNLNVSFNISSWSRKTLYLYFSITFFTFWPS